MESGVLNSLISKKLLNVLKDHQVEGIKFMAENILNGQGCILAHSMGLGKTAQIIILISVLLRAGVLENQTVLVLTPKSTLLNWSMEFEKWCGLGDLRRDNPSLRMFSIADGVTMPSRLRIISQWADQGGVMFLGYEQYTGVLKKQKRVKKIANLLICDEGHRIKKSDSNLAVALAKAKTKNRIILTGTPLQNNLMEYWSMVEFVRPGMIKKSHFDQYFKAPIEAGQVNTASTAAITLMRERSYILSKTLAACVLRKDQSILHASLPKKNEFIIYCPMTNFQRSLYYTYKDSYSEHQKRKTLLAYICGINKIGAHPDLLRQYLERRNDKDVGWVKIILDVFNNSPSYKPGLITDSPKLLVLLYLFVDCMTRNRKMLIFSQYVETLNYLEGILRRTDQGKRTALFRLDGSCSGTDRENSMKKFQSLKGEPAVFLISTLAGGVGINLNTAHAAVLFDVSFNPANDQQAIFRCYRYGLEHPVDIYRLVSEGTPESAMYSRCISKEWVSRKVVDEQIPTREYMNTVDLRVVFTNECEADDTAAAEHKWHLEKKYCLETSTALRTAVAKLEERGHIIKKLHRHESLLIDDREEEAGERERSAYQRYEENLAGRKNRKKNKNKMLVPSDTISELSEEAQIELAIQKSLQMEDALLELAAGDTHQTVIENNPYKGPDLTNILKTTVPEVVDVDESTIVDSESGENILQVEDTELSEIHKIPDHNDDDDDDDENDSELERAIQESLMMSRVPPLSDEELALSLSAHESHPFRKLPPSEQHKEHKETPDHDLICALEDAGMQPESFGVGANDEWDDLSSEPAVLPVRKGETNLQGDDEPPEYWMNPSHGESVRDTNMEDINTSDTEPARSLGSVDSGSVTLVTQPANSVRQPDDANKRTKRPAADTLNKDLKRHQPNEDDSFESLLGFSSEEEEAGTPIAQPSVVLAEDGSRIPGSTEGSAIKVDVTPVLNLPPQPDYGSPEFEKQTRRNLF
eukprot:TRINITY_DN7162_c0_g1_i3.p1 TRINITY_DN7162_c0_g1~~TRINITY_DN7162_c0_g1_i3.p1  ORF type:complete len:983 (+),score=185.92 TRINITY_DN7162_c0_g1_i3:45-2993(+)